MTTKVFLFSAEVFPSSVKSILRRSADIEICETPAGVAVILIYAEQWNRKALVKIQPMLLDHRARAVVISDRLEEPFHTRFRLTGSDLRSVVFHCNS